MATQPAQPSRPLGRKNAPGHALALQYLKVWTRSRMKRWFSQAKVIHSRFGINSRRQRVSRTAELPRILGSKWHSADAWPAVPGLWNWTAEAAGKI